MWIFIQECILDSGLGLLLNISKNAACQDSLYYREKGYLGHSKLLLTMKKIQSVDELYPFMRHLGSHAYYNLVDQEIPDLSLIDQVVLNDFVEKNE